MSYFEFEDVRRFHQPYTDPFQSMPVWKNGFNNSPYQNWRRGFFAMSTGALIMEPIRHFAGHAKILNFYYEWPKTRMEANIFFREVTRTSEFWPELFKKVGFGLLAGGLDTSIKLASWQYIYGGTWSPAEYVDYNTFKPILCAIVSQLPFCWTAIPLENARRAYYADKTWPVELRRNYRSPLNALLRIPLEEGVWYLFKGGLPIATSHYIFWSSFLTTYQWLKKTFFFLWIYQDFGYNYCKFGFMSVSWLLSWFLAYPAYFAREMVDIWPKERGGHCTWNNNYRQCYKWMFENMDTMMSTYMTNFWGHMLRQGVSIFIACWIADNLGMFSNGSESFNGIESSHPIQSEAI